MINSFLVTLVNDPTQPTNPASVVGDILWPSHYLPRTLTSAETEALSLLFQNESDPLFKLCRAIQLLWVVEESVCADKIIETSPLVSYNLLQLQGQFANVTDADVSRQNVSRILSTFSWIQAPSFLRSDLLAIYREAPSRLDKLAAIISHFGVRPS